MDPQTKDLLLFNARIMDGSAGKAFPGEVLISGDRILCTGKKGEYTFSCCQKIDCGNLVLAPGFIDAHSHSDLSLFAAPDAPSSIFQGVTTLITGNCGLSPFPVITEEVREHLQQIYEKYNEKIQWNDFSGYAAELQKRSPAVNILPLCGHNTLKANIDGYDGRKNGKKEDYISLVALLDKMLSQGAGGLSTGLLYIPGRTSENGELAALMGCLKKFNRIYATHLRSEGKALTEAVREAIALAKCGSRKLQISHLKTSGRTFWHKLPEVFNCLEQAQKDGVLVTADRYPYTFSATSLSLVLPGQYEEMTDSAIREKLAADHAERERLAGELDSSPRNWTEVLLADTQWEKMKSFRGKSIKEIADALRSTPGKTVLDILTADAPNAMGAFAGMSRENLAKILQKDYVCCGSDETSRPFDDSLGRSHPRNFGSFPRFFQLLCSLGFSQEEAVARMTALPAKIFSLHDRGRIREGCKADLVLFDPEKLDSNADFIHPHTKAEGIRAVIVNGCMEDLEGNGKNTLRKRNGQVLKLKTAF
ncbi:MAG: amidohydrolase family protein [Lentisphaeria bacterium]|nr:amidohydrolase family protein [Lentisphaeria bacterium]